MIKNKTSLLGLTLCLWGILLLIPGSIFAQATNETVLFTSINPSQWLVTGRVNFQPTDTALRFVFGFDEDNPPRFPPDTTELEINSEFDFSNFGSVRLVYETYDLLPHIDSWVDGNIRFFISHEYHPNWVETTDILSSFAGWAKRVRFKMKVSVRSNPQHPGSFIITNFRIVGQPR